MSLNGESEDLIKGPLKKYKISKFCIKKSTPSKIHHWTVPILNEVFISEVWSRYYQTDHHATKIDISA